MICSGRVYQRDLGVDSAKIASKIKSYDLHKGWTLSVD